MGKLKAFMEVPRVEAGYRPIHDRIQDFGEVEQTLNTHDRKTQASRCMDCGVPFCHWACPLGNKCPEWNDALYKGEWEQAYRLLNATNDFPEFTGRICPALCEKSCVLNLTDHAATTNRENEAAITEAAWREKYIAPQQYERNGRKVAVIGAGPAGLVAANRLNKKGYSVTVFEKNEAAGGLLRYGIPNFKLNKKIIDRRIALLEEEGITFKYNCAVEPNALPEGFDAYVISTGTPQARDLNVPGRELKGVHLALELLSQQNRVLAGMEFSNNGNVRAIMGGVNNKPGSVLYEGSKEEVQARAWAYAAEGGRTGYVLSADCSLKPDVDYERLRWVVEAMDAIAQNVQPGNGYRV